MVGSCPCPPSWSAGLPTGIGDDPHTYPERGPVSVCDHRSMSLSMSIEEREGFLADVHVGILSVSRPSLGPLSVPVWYSYAAGGVVTFITGATRGKAGL